MKTIWQAPLLWGIFFAVVWQAVESDAVERIESGLGTQITSFALADQYGRKHSLADIDAEIVVVAFLGTECPLAKLYGPRLESLAGRFRDRGVAFFGINSNSQDSPTKIAAYAQRHKISFPMLKDLGNRVADQFAAVRTPEVFVLDKQRTIRYWGRIDDQYGVGYQRPAPIREDLAIAVEELLAGDPVSVPKTKSLGCHIGRAPTIPAHGDVTFAKHIAPIFNNRCVECHREGEIAPFSLASFADVEGWGPTITEVVEEERMPPWPANPAFGHFRNNARLTETEKQLIYRWVENGMPSGDLDDLPPAPKFVKGWRIPEPDQVVFMRDEPFVVPAKGVVDYQYFEVDPGFTEDKFIAAAEARPENRATVHHIIVYIKPPGSNSFRNHGAVTGYAPGSLPTAFESGIARRVPAGSKFVFELHYTPNGSEQHDRSYVGLKFVDESQVRKQVHNNLAIDEKFVIPPNANDHKVVARRRIKHDQLLLNMTPHMHVRGKAFRFEAIFPDGKRETLLDVPRYDFNWQLTYELAEPILLPKGSQVVCTAHFDNSPANPVNPDPSKEVRWGDQSWDEMMIGFFSVVEP